MSAGQVLDDLMELDRLADEEDDLRRRERLQELRARLAARAEAAKVSEAAEVLEVSEPTVRSWIAARVLELVPDRRPKRVTLESLATTKAVVDELRASGSNARLLAAIARSLRDRATLSDANVTQGLDDLREGRHTPLTQADLDGLIERSAIEPSSTSN